MDRYFCVKCKMYFTGHFLWEMRQRRISTGERPVEVSQNALYEMRLHDLNRIIHNLQAERDKLKFQLETMQGNIMRSTKLYHAAKTVTVHAHAGVETPDDEIEAALTRLIATVTEYESHVGPMTEPELQGVDVVVAQPTNDWEEWTSQWAKYVSSNAMPSVEDVWLLYEHELIAPEVAAEALGYSDVAVLQFYHRRRLRQQVASCLLNLINKKIEVTDIGGHE